ncbi:hypothetical protein [Nitrospirillum viridazoti]|uniref:Uncharacterized protein n=1 Tax=Nitrospirillum viridazoti CBAmc TaxID=1441467 RepID=A0A248JV61_9PROT|nr:hypothetical protein [Nitrospirillum amazonense]ASG22104.1 hypothetical protein Y958_14065 [Nitrospirillum amazonense CBAmc]TWB32761.1 hypothetical protein FBZ91_11690 [Nitrospirillum amazonense]
MTTVRSLLTGLFLGLPFLVAPAILVAAPRPDIAAVAQGTPAPAATLAATPSGKLKVIPARMDGAKSGGVALPCKATTATIIKAHAGRSVPHQLIALN